MRDVVVKTMMEDYGNPSSKHTKGMEAEKYLRESREIIAKTLKVNEKEDLFYLRRNGRAITGPSLERPWPTVAPGKHIITTAIEHAGSLTAHAVSAGAGL